MPRRIEKFAVQAISFPKTAWASATPSYSPGNPCRLLRTSFTLMLPTHSPRGLKTIPQQLDLAKPPQIEKHSIEKAAASSSHKPFRGCKSLPTRPYCSQHRWLAEILR